MLNKTSKKEKPKIETKVPVYNFLDGKEIKAVHLNEKVFDGSVNKALLHQAVVMYQANSRSGTASTKTRGEVSGGGKKPWKQKGTGRARAGSTRSPLWRGGGAVFGPHPKDYSYSIPRKIKKLAVRSALNAKLIDGELLLVEEIKLNQPKTKVFYKALKNILKVKRGAHQDLNVVLITGSADKNLKLSSRNLQRVAIIKPSDVTAYDILLHRKLIISESALETLYKRINV